MIRLDKTTRTLQAVTDGVSSTNPVATVTYVDRVYLSEHRDTHGTTQITNLNSTTDVTIAAAPKQGFIRWIESIAIYNADNASRIVTVKIDTSATDTIIVKRTLAVGETLFYESGSGWGII